MKKVLSVENILRLFKYWPPYLAAGISVRDFNLEKGFIVSQMKISKWNQNYFGTFFGGSLYAMCDPFYVFLLVEKLGKDYIVWDVEAGIKFRKATRQTVHARFEITASQVEAIKLSADNGKTVTPEFETHIYDELGVLIADVTKKLYVKRK